MKTYRIENFKGVVSDTGFGNQPEGTVSSATNLVLDKKAGSLATRGGCSAGLTPPAALTTLDYHITKPTTFPSSVDNHLYFGKVSAVKTIWKKPFYHNGSTASTDDNGWVDLAENIDLSGISAGDVTVNGSTTNTIVIDNAAAKALSFTADYYKNWQFFIKGAGSTTRLLVKSYSYNQGADRSTFTLDTVVSIATGVTLTAAEIAAANTVAVYRYFHQVQSSNTVFAPSYTAPAGYGNAFAVRWSGGASSSTDHKGCWCGYQDKTFFPSDGTYKHLWQGSYAEVAECLAPLSAMLKSSSVDNAIGTMIITNANDYQFSGSSTNWTANGNHTANLAVDPLTGLQGLLLNATGDGDATNNRAALSITLASATSYKMRLYFGNQVGSNDLRNLNGSPYTLVISFNGTEIKRMTALTPSGEFELSIPAFTVTGATANLTFHFLNAPPCPVLIRFVNIYATSSDNFGLTSGNTFSFYASFVYDGYQESELTYLGKKFVSLSHVLVANTFKLRLGELNKRITGIRLYYSEDKGDTTLASYTGSSGPRYFYRELSLVDSATTWNMNTTTGYFECVDNFNQTDIDNAEVTWEEKTNRLESSATSYSYGVTESAAGLNFLAQFYDYTAEKLYTNVLQFNGTNGDGLVCEDIFPDDEDSFREKILSGNGTDIKGLLEYQGDLLIWKDASFLKLITTMSPYVLKVVDNNTGLTNAYSAQKLLGGVVYANLESIYYWDGAFSKDLLEFTVKQWWHTISDAGTLLSWVDKYDRSFNVLYQDENAVKVKLGFLGFFPQTYSITPQAVATVKDGSVYLTSSAGVSRVLDSSATDAGTNITTDLRIGDIMPVRDAFLCIDELRIDVSVADGSTIGTQPTVDLKADGTTIKTYTPTIVAGNNFVRLKVPPHKAARSFYVRIADLAATGQISFNNVELDYDIVQEYGDKRVA